MPASRLAVIIAATVAVAVPCRAQSSTPATLKLPLVYSTTPMTRNTGLAVGVDPGDGCNRRWAGSPRTAALPRTRSALNLLDAALWSESIGLLRDHVWNGEADVRVRWLRLGGARVLPLVRYELSPHGPEYYVDALSSVRRLRYGLRPMDGANRSEPADDVEGFGMRQGLVISGTVKIARRPMV